MCGYNTYYARYSFGAAWKRWYDLMINVSVIMALHVMVTDKYECSGYLLEIKGHVGTYIY